MLAYVMLTGYSPFAGETKQETFLNISQVNIDFPDDLFEDVTTTAQEFMMGLLVREPRYEHALVHCKQFRDAIFPDFSGIPDFHKSKLSMKNYNFNPKLERFRKLLLF